MKSCKSYTCKISGNQTKLDFLEEQLNILADLSWYVFHLQKTFPQVNWWSNQKKLYHSCRKMFPELKSKLIQNFISLYKPKKGKKNPRNPIKPEINLTYQEFNLQNRQDNKLSSFWLRFFKKNFPLFGKYLMKKILDPTKVKLVQIFRKKNKLYCKLGYVEEVNVPKSSNNPKTVGLDVNTKRIVLSNNRFYSLKRLYHSKIEHHKNNQKKRNKANYTKDYLHKLTTQIADDLQNEGVEVLVLEDLRNLRKSASRKLGTSKGKLMNYIINSMSFGMFRDFLKYKCLDRGIKIETINPKNTSKTCSKCGSLNTSRPKQTSFKCLDCGFQLDADLNGSRNIRNFYMSSLWATSESSPGLDLLKQSKANTLLLYSNSQGESRWFDPNTAHWRYNSIRQNA